MEKMSAETRRLKILSLLSEAEAPICAANLASDLGVTRQVIVNDIALLRASGHRITSHVNGYVVEKAKVYSRVLKVRHSDEDAEKELNLIVDAGGTVDDVFVYHRVYGKVRAEVGIKSRLQIRQYLEGIASGKSSLLKNVTSGYHYHTVSADSIETLDLIQAELKACGFLAPLQDHEPFEIGK